MPNISVNTNGSFQSVKNIFVNINGTWTSVKNAYIKNAGVWSLAYTKELYGITYLSQYQNMLTGSVNFSTYKIDYLVYNNGVYLAGTVTANNYYFYSTDGLVWSMKTSPNSGIAHIVAGKGLFVLSQKHGEYFYSTDGLNWSLGTTTGSSTSNLTRLHFVNDTFFALASGNYIQSSSNGINWEQISLPTTSQSYGLAYGNGVYIITNYGTLTNAYLYSTNGTNWTARTFPSTKISCKAVAFVNNFFICFDYTTTTAYYSNNGLNWTKFSTTSFTYVESVAVFNNVGYVSNSNATNYFLRFTDPSQISTFTYPKYPKTDSAVYNSFITCNNKLFLTSGGTNRHLIFYMITENIWNKAPGVLSNASYRDIVFFKDKFFAVDNDTTKKNFIHSSNDGENFNILTLGTVEYWNSITCNDNILIVCSTNSTMGYYYTTDGINWIYNTTTLTSGSGSKILFVNNLFFKIGLGSNIYQTSSDGINWTQRTFPASINCYTIIYGNNLFILFLNSSTTYYTSPDGINWTSRTFPISTTPLDVVYNGSLFLYFISTNATYYTSPDGINWTSRTFPDNQVVTELISVNNVFIGSQLTTLNRLIFSTDGINWVNKVLSVAVPRISPIFKFFNNIFYIYSKTVEKKFFKLALNK